MADLSEVSTAIVGLFAPYIYPNGTGQHSSITAPCKIYPGWPVPNQLQADLLAGTVNISVYPQPSIERVTTRYPTDWRDYINVTPTVTATVSGLTVTLGGTFTAGHFVTIFAGSNVSSSYGSITGLSSDGFEYFTYVPIMATDINGLAAGLAAQFPVGVVASVAGPVITFAAQYQGRLKVRTGAPNTVIRELRRQQRGYQIVIWAPTPDLRSAAAKIIDPILSSTDFVTLPDSTFCWLTYRASNDDDNREPNSLYRRDIFLWAEYPTTQTMTAYPVTDFVTQYVAGTGVPITPTPFGVNTPGYTFTPVIKTVNQ